ncbi:ferric reductase like transmembrane component-domain-containing protein [Penicillium odoratum]|uniref:ferric reductase like transmembrane component-domain-containing protein n=1 Tax=Penicillium odoratum TaxID=1167516 RepID=UPI00254733B1|nr:ferric reductase like transmembrane component-domain-containing protein [Penicillium odoratum]KAJ5758451.1 ferric reductase like transmembrane component-domain-containing protein [Penicillium odoratum]
MPTTNDPLFTGAVCMSITVVGNTTYLPLSDPFCNTEACLAFAKAQKASQSAISYAHQFDYGHYTTWYYLATLGVGIAIHILRLYRNQSSHQPQGPPNQITATGHKVIALCRAVSYRSVGGLTAARWGFPKLGMLTFGIFTLVFFLLMTFLVHPYYRERRGYGSPPLAVRTGLMSTALIPLIVALSGKVNIVTWLTGISHEKLNIFHRWASYLCLFLAIVHTVPFIVTPLQNCGAAGLHAQFYKPGAFEYTGVPPLGMLVGLCVLSVPIIRHRFYNFFYRVHVPMYVAFLGLMFWHSGNEMDSWAYLWATLAIWLFQVSGRLFAKWQTFNVHRSWFSGFSTSLQKLPGEMVHVTLLVPIGLRWKPGQHCWLRMPHLSPLQNHPFTIANLPSQEVRTKSDIQVMEFYIRAYNGLTRNLLQSVVDYSDRSVPMHVDGPYGGLNENPPGQYESLVFVCGGSGISACMPHILYALKASHQGSGVVKSIRLVWMVQDRFHKEWITNMLKEASSLPGLLHLDVYITRPTKAVMSVSGTELELVLPQAKEMVSRTEESMNDISPQPEKTPEIWTVRHTRPYLPEILPPLLTERRTFVFGKGTIQ